MCTPTAQDYFSHVRHDDPGIGATDRLLRNCRQPVQIVPCKVAGLKISDQIFRKKPNEPGVSVDLECLLQKEGLSWEHQYGAQPDTLAMVAVTAQQARHVSAGVAHTPKPEQPELAPRASSRANPYHGEIIGDISRSNGRELSRQAVVLRCDL